MYKYEIHLHDSKCSKCGMSSASQMLLAAKEHGYSGVIFTNHFYRGNTAIDRKLPWAEFVDAYKQDWLEAKAFGDQIGMDVLFGIEEGYGNGKEVLIYGLSAEAMQNNPSMPKMTINELSTFVRENGGFIACAHPFRNRPYITDPYAEPDPSCFDGVEVYNHFNTNEDNAKALDFAKRNGLIPISGGDIHSSSNFGVAGLAFARRITDEKELVKALKSRDFKLIIGDKLVDPMC